MEPVGLLRSRRLHFGSCIAQKRADATIDAVGSLEKQIPSATHDEPNAREVVEQTTAATLADPALFDEVEAVFQHSPALRRAKLVHAVLTALAFSGSTTIQKTTRGSELLAPSA